LYRAEPHPGAAPHPQEIRHPVSGRPAVHDWRGDYVGEAVATGHPLVLEMLFATGYNITWQNAQVWGASRPAAIGAPAHN
jgi:hypothetical protein